MSWKRCPEGVATDSSRLRCATVPVPIDYADPDGPQIRITISRLGSTNPSTRRGVLLLNPGGPGGSGLDQPEFLASKGLPDSVLDRYDLIGMDTRGIGHSSPVSCGFTDSVPYHANIPPYAVDRAAVVDHARVSEQVAKRCAARDRTGLLAHVTTANMARDLDRIRDALGEATASYLGYSYGASLGAAYASMFPERTDRVVLDSNYGDTHLDRDGLRRYALGMEQTFPDFARWAAERDDLYGLGGTQEEVRRTYLTIAGRLDRTPADGIDGARFRFNTFVSLYNRGLYEETAKAWASLLSSGEDVASPPATTPSATPPSATPPSAKTPQPAPSDNAWSVFLAVTCNDVRWPDDIATYQRAVEEDRDRYPLFGAAAANITPCAYWQHEPGEPPVQVDDDGPRNVLIVQNRFDPVTPLRGGELLHEQFGRRSSLVTVEASGHGAYILSGNTCARNTVSEYLTDGEIPRQDTACPSS